MTTEELLALPDDGKERWLIAGKLHESPRLRLARRDRRRCYAMTQLACEMEMWRRRSGKPSEVLTGDVGVCLRHDPDTTIGLDLVNLLHESPRRQSPQKGVIEVCPKLAVEILASVDTFGDINEHLPGLRIAVRSLFE